MGDAHNGLGVFNASPDILSNSDGLGYSNVNEYNRDFINTYSRFLNTSIGKSNKYTQPIYAMLMSRLIKRGV